MAMKWTCQTIGGAKKFACVSIALFAAATTQADPIITTTGSFTEVSIPADLSTGIFESDISIFIMFESTQTLIGDFFADSGGVLAGTTFDSYLVHFDRVGGGIPGLRLAGGVTFASNILGIDFLDGTLNARDALLGAAGTIYPAGEFSRGIELGPLPTGDGLSIAGSTLTASLHTDNWVDQFRIYTAVTVPVPEPSSLLLFCSGFAAMFFARTRRRLRSN